jgi:hypothetical protein
MRCTSLLFFLALAGSMVNDVYAFVEEACFFPGELKALYQTQIDLGCKVDDRRTVCTAASLASGNDTFGATTCRGFLHFDAIYFMAQALGYTPDAAYWLALMSVQIDFVQYTATDSCGNALEDAYQSPPLRGMLRTSTITGSHIRHLGILYGIKRPPASGLYPNVQSYESEGMLAQARDWAFGKSNMLCTLGITVPSASGNVFKGPKCLDDGSYVNNTIFPPSFEPIIKGPIPTAPANTTLGDQIVQFNCQGDPECSLPTPENMIDIVKVTDMYAYFKAGPYAKLKGGDTIPELWIRFGIYLHQLADRNSHYYMTDPKNTAVVKDPKDSKQYHVLWDAQTANFINHGNEHSWEQMLKPGLPPQSWAILNNYYKELVAFKTAMQKSHPSWFMKKYKAMSRSQLVGDKKKKGLMVQLAEQQDIVERMLSFRDFLVKNGYATVPGQAKACPTWKRTKVEL